METSVFNLKEKPVSVTGPCTIADLDTLTFIWKMDGLLGALVYRWQIKLLDPAHNWLVAYYSKSLLSGDSLTILSKTGMPNAPVLIDILAKLRALNDPQVNQHLPQLRFID